MISKIIINVDNIDYLEDYRKVGLITFLFPLDGYSIGYKAYSIDEINKIDVSNKYVLLNRILDCKDIDYLKDDIDKLKGIKGIIFEDIGVYNILKDRKDIELILFQNHFNCNTLSINFWLDRVNSVVVDNELTYEELESITKNAKNEVILHLYGYNQVMYSRRRLLNNWSKEFNIDYKDTNVITDKATKVRFRAKESEYGTVMYSDKIFNGRRLLNLSNVKYYYVNTSMIDHKDIMEYLNDINRDLKDNEDEGFLDKETIYKLKER